MDTNRSNTDDAAGSKTVADVLRLSCELAEEARDRQVSGKRDGFQMDDSVDELRSRSIYSQSIPLPYGARGISRDTATSAARHPSACRDPGTAHLFLPMTSFTPVVPGYSQWIYVEVSG